MADDPGLYLVVFGCFLLAALIVIFVGTWLVRSVWQVFVGWALDVRDRRAP